MSYLVVLHPGLKLEYFCQHKWEEEWIEQAENMVQEEYIRTYEDKNTDTTASAETTTKVCWDYYYGLHCIYCFLMQVNGMRGIAEFANISVDPTTTPKVSEIDDYLRQPVENVAEPLKWWYDKCCVFPNLSQMALDYLSIPGKFNSLDSCFILI